MNRKLFLISSILIIIFVNNSFQNLIKKSANDYQPIITEEMKEMADSMFRALKDVLSEKKVPERNLLLTKNEADKLIKKKEMKMVFERKKSN